jgi:hypothetical protein
MNKAQIDDGTTMYVVLSDLGIDGPFFTLRAQSNSRRRQTARYFTTRER